MKSTVLSLLARSVPVAAALAGCGLFGYERLELTALPGTAEHCQNQQLDGDELGLDCGGPSCPVCALGVACTPGPGCDEPLCLEASCVAPSCSDGVQNQDETATDCGGALCAACAGAECSNGSDCGSLICNAGACAAATCSDGVQNQGEARIDCGGSQCAPCPPTCSDGAQNQDETGTDCGGSQCAACPGAQCTSGAQCASQICAATSCQAPTCSDGVQNQDEAGIDCGGASCAPCPSCSDGVQNQDEAGIDCGGASCAPCPSCSDGVQNQDEAGIDCGGACAPCVTCSDGIQNQDETGTDCGGASCVACGVNTPPLARFTVTPGVGAFDSGPATVFSADASGSSDLQDAASALGYSWDWENDGVEDATGPSSTHSYGSAGTYEVRLTVQDSGGLRATATFLVIVSSASNVVLVTTAADEADVGATPANAQGTGLSLREAISYANATAGKQSVLVPAGFAIALDSQLPSSTDDAGLDLVGDGALWDGASTGPADDCIQVPSAQTRIFGFEIQNCRRSPIRLAFGAAGSQFSRLNIHDFGVPVILNDANVIFGPDNQVSGGALGCIDVVGAGTTVHWNFLDNCGTRAVDLTGSSSGSLVLGNVITRSDPGIFLGNGASNCSIVHNVFHANTGDGVWLGGVVNSADVLQNNIFSSNAGFGVRMDNAPFASNDHNDYFDNALGTCSGCSSLGAGSSTANPGFIDAAAGDFRLGPASPNLDAGIDTGQDVNGPAPGNGLFNGSNPDIGAREMN